MLYQSYRVCGFHRFILPFGIISVAISVQKAMLFCLAWRRNRLMIWCAIDSPRGTPQNRSTLTWGLYRYQADAVRCLPLAWSAYRAFVSMLMKSLLAQIRYRRLIYYKRRRNYERAAADHRSIICLSACKITGLSRFGSDRNMIINHAIMKGR